MKRVMAIAIVLVTVMGATLAEAQTRRPQGNAPIEQWAVCQLGKAPVVRNRPAPNEAQVFASPGGPVIMSEDGPGSSIRWIQCRLPAGTPSYRGADGVLRDVESNQPYFPVMWDAAPPVALKGERGEDGISCWDINMNHAKDAAEDINGDGVVDVLDCRGAKGDKGNDGEPGKTITVIDTGGDSKWGVVGEVAFSYVPELGGSVAASFLGRENCNLKGVSFGLGLAREDDHGYWEVLATGKTISGSTFAYCRECNQEAYTEADGVMSWGARVGRIQTFSDKNWRPALVVEGGFQTLTGKTRQYIATVGGKNFPPEDGGAEKLFGSKVIGDAVLAVAFPVKTGSVKLMPMLGFSLPHGGFVGAKLLF